MQCITHDTPCNCLNSIDGVPLPVAQTNQLLSLWKYKYMSAIGKKKAKPRTQNTDWWMRALALAARGGGEGGGGGGGAAWAAARDACQSVRRALELEQTGPCASVCDGNTRGACMKMA